MLLYFTKRSVLKNPKSTSILIGNRKSHKYFFPGLFNNYNSHDRRYHASYSRMDLYTKTTLFAVMSPVEICLFVNILKSSKIPQLPGGNYILFHFIFIYCFLGSFTNFVRFRQLNKYLRRPVSLDRNNINT